MASKVKDTVLAMSPPVSSSQPPQRSLRTLLQSERSHIKVKRRCRWTPINILQCVRYYNMYSIVYNITNISILWLPDAEPFICQPQEASSSSQVFFRRDSVPFGVKTRDVVAVRRAGAQTGIAALVQEASDSLRLPHRFNHLAVL